MAISNTTQATSIRDEPSSEVLRYDLDYGNRTINIDFPDEDAGDLRSHSTNFLRIAKAIAHAASLQARHGDQQGQPAEGMGELTSGVEALLSLSIAMSDAANKRDQATLLGARQ
jgi:hypothetical protein